MIRDRLLFELQAAPSGMSLPSLLSTMKIDSGAPNSAAVEAILLLSPDIYFAESRWRASLKGKAARILGAIEGYASSTGKKVFRASSALSSLAVDEHPTADELRDVLDSCGGRFTLLPNEMIRRNA